MPAGLGCGLDGCREALAHLKCKASDLNNLVLSGGMALSAASLRSEVFSLGFRAFYSRILLVTLFELGGACLLERVGVVVPSSQCRPTVPTNTV